jgi:Icc-related predicted phosphoesterase
MRIVAVADTHTFEAELGTIPDGDVFVHAGDMVRAGSLEEMELVARWVRSLPHKHKIVVAGNHDWCFQRTPQQARALFGDEITYSQDSGCAIDGVRFWGSPWQPEFCNWAFNLPRGEPLAERWALIPDDTDVLITHGPPFGFGDSTWADRAGCSDLLAAARRVKPALHLFGHIHQDGGFWRDGGVCFCNATTWECERAATVLDIDPESKAVTEVSVPPRGR